MASPRYSRGVYLSNLWHQHRPEGIQSSAATLQPLNVILLDGLLALFDEIGRFLWAAEIALVDKRPELMNPCGRVREQGPAGEVAQVVIDTHQKGLVPIANSSF